MNITEVNRSGKTWDIRYSYWTGKRIGANKKSRTVTVNSTWKPTRSAAEDYARDDVLALIGRTKGQYGYTGIKIDWIGKNGKAVLTTTLQPKGTPAAITHVPTRPIGSAFV